MDLTTRCPKCNTVFQASLADLQLRKGYIRCVQCAYIFDGYAEVVSDSDKEPFLQDIDLSVDSESGDSTGIRQTNSADFDHHINAPVDFDTGPDFKIADSNESLVQENDQFRINIDNERKSAQTESFFLEANPSRRVGSGSVYSVGQTSALMLAIRKFFAWLALILLVLLLAFQGSYIYRAQIAQNLNFTRPLLEKYCSYLNCTVPYLRDIDSLVITKSALKLVKPEAISDSQAQQADHNNEQTSKPTNSDQPELQLRNYELEFNLRNLAKQAQEWPTVVLNLKDSSGQVQIKRNLTPSDYLEHVTPAIAAQSEVFISLPVKLKGNTQVNGFHLDLFFP